MGFRHDDSPMMRAFSISLSVVAVALLMGCSSQSANTRSPATDKLRDALVAAPGLVEPRSEEIKIGAELSARIKSVLVDEGDHVARGQIIAFLENTDYQARVDAAEAQLNQRKAELQRLISGARAEEREIARLQLEEADAVLRNSEKDLDRRQKLLKDGDIAKEEVDRAERDHAVAKARYDQAKESHILINAAARADDVARAEAAVAAADGAVREARALLDKTVVRSSMTGVVLRRNLKSGEMARSAGTAIVTLGDTAGIRVRVDVDEADIGKVSVGQRAFVSAQAYGDRKFEGRVVSIGQKLGKKNVRTEEPTERIDTKILETLIELDGDPRLPTGLRVNAFIVVGSQVLDHVGE